MKILVVEDDLVTLQTLAFALEAEGYEVITASDGKKALDAVQKEDTIGLVISDIMMPNMSGLGLLTALHQRFGNTLPVLFISALDHGHLISSLSIGSTEFISKPIDFDDLIQRVKDYATKAVRPSS
jgi:DNA-binding response OmpR family regulator